ncbi:phage holin, partial [Streptococcus pyogenes]|uniref:phage holin n=1 Tax=Streptococcus pyogenes TaxID=1314 RepID=UPI0020C61F90
MRNWKVTGKYPQFDSTGAVASTHMAILGAIFLLAQQLGIKLPSNIADIANTAVTLLVLLGVVTDPTTQG